jgi:DNA-binding PadR family transcriptional regulator
LFTVPFNFSKRTHRGLRHWILSMLQDNPKNGVELMNGMEALSRGWWRPSPGSVYPILASMAKEGVIEKLPDGRYELTDAGKQEIYWPMQFRPAEPRSVDEVLEQVSGYVSYLEDLSSTDAAKVAGCSEKLGTLSERLAKLGGKRE